MASRHRQSFSEAHLKARAEAIANGITIKKEQINCIFPDEWVGQRKYRRMDSVIYTVQQKALKLLKEEGMRASTVEALVAGYMAELVDAKRKESGKDPIDWDWESLLQSYSRSKTDPQYVEGVGSRPPLRRKVIDTFGVPVELKPTKEELKNANRTP